MRFVAVLLPMLVVVGGCCYEGYVRPKSEEVPIGHVPARVREALARGYHVGDVTRVEHGWFHSRCSSDWEQYRFHLQSGHAITLDENGRLTKWWWDHLLPASPPLGGAPE